MKRGRKKRAGLYGTNAWACNSGKRQAAAVAAQRQQSAEGVDGALTAWRARARGRARSARTGDHRLQGERRTRGGVTQGRRRRPSSGLGTTPKRDIS